MATAVFLLVSGLYFADTLLRASLKTFWMDELFTVYLCRLPSFHATWTAVMHGTDFNPPLFYLVTRGVEHLFGEGLIATRLPGIVGFWVYGICLYLFVSRRLNRVAGGIAALFPFFTIAHLYAFEARSHGMVLAWSGLMLLCWQRARERPRFSFWLLGFSAAFLAALLTHVYAIYFVIPYLAVEAYNFMRRRGVHLGILLALALTSASVLPLYLSLIRAYKSLTSLGGLQNRIFDVIQQHLLTILGPSLAIFVTILVLSAWEHRNTASSDDTNAHCCFDVSELFLATGFVLMPFIGILTVRFSHGPFFDRYFLSSTAGYAILIAQASVYRSSRNLVAKRLFGLMTILLLASTMLAVRYHARHYFGGQVEPSSHFAFVADPASPLSSYGSLLNDRGSSDILVTSEPVFLYLHYYAPPSLRRRLIFGASNSDDIFLRSYRRLSESNVDLRTTTFSEFFKTHNDFLVYGSSDGLLNGGCFDCMDDFLRAGYTLKSVTRDYQNLLEHFER